MMIENDDRVLLEVKNVKKYFPVKSKKLFEKSTRMVKAVDDVSFFIRKGETLGLVGESGCGKTTVGKCIVRLKNCTSGQIIYNDNGVKKDLLDLTEQESFDMRRRVQMVFQDPYSSLNPTKTIYTTLDEPLKIHGLGTKEERKEKIAELLKAVNLRPDYMYRYPHEFSGGQRQRICIARSLMIDPELIVCDEPVSALDVSIQAQVLNLMKDLQAERNLTYLFIAHDLSVVEYMSDRIAVMYLGHIVELADAESLYYSPEHPYTEALLSAIPIPDIDEQHDRIILEGDVPSPADPPAGCCFHTRCRKCSEICRCQTPELRPLKGNPEHFVACHFADTVDE